MRPARRPAEGDAMMSRTGRTAPLRRRRSTSRVSVRTLPGSPERRDSSAAHVAGHDVADVQPARAELGEVVVEPPASVAFR